jgi:hypothetical protein
VTEPLEAVFLDTNVLSWLQSVPETYPFGGNDLERPI